MTEPIIHPPKPRWLQEIEWLIKRAADWPQHVTAKTIKRVRFTLSPDEWLEYKQWQRDMGYVTATRAINECPIYIEMGNPSIQYEMFGDD